MNYFSVFFFFGRGKGLVFLDWREMYLAKGENGKRVRNDRHDEKLLKGEVLDGG